MKWILPQAKEMEHVFVHFRVLVDYGTAAGLSRLVETLYDHPPALTTETYRFAQGFGYGTAMTGPALNCESEMWN